MGIFASTFPALTNQQEEFDKETNTRSWGSAVFWISMLFLSNIPYAISGVYKEYSLKTLVRAHAHHLAAALSRH